MDAGIQNALSLEAERLLAEEARLEYLVQKTERDFSGLRDIDAILRLAAAKLSLCLNLMKRTAIEQREQIIAEKALAALRLVESLLAENVSGTRGVSSRRIPATPRSGPCWSVSSWQGAAGSSRPRRPMRGGDGSFPAASWPPSAGTPPLTTAPRR
jgi:hypothetical protein